MRKTVRKLFWAWDFEKEEIWLNEMSARGLHLADVGFCTYVFDEGTPSEYTIRLQMLNHHPIGEKSGDYIRFVSESGAEHIGNMFRWAYFRKKTNGEEFQLFSDIDSRMRQINRLLVLFCALTLSEGMISLSRLLDFQNQTLSLPIVIALGVIACLFAYASLKIWRIRRKLMKERALRE